MIQTPVAFNIATSLFEILVEENTVEVLSVLELDFVVVLEILVDVVDVEVVVEVVVVEVVVVVVVVVEVV